MERLLREQDQKYGNTEYAALYRVEQEYPWSSFLLEKLRQRSEWSYQASRRVGVMCYGMARVLGFPEDEILRLTASGLLHDVGKAEIPPKILDKPGGLSNEEMAVMQAHSRVGFAMIRPFDEAVAKRVVTVHEFQQNPYPRRAIREEEDPDIIRDGRLIAIADSTDRLMSVSPYKTEFFAIEDTVSKLKNVPLFGNDAILHTAAVIRSFL